MSHRGLEIEVSAKRKAKMERDETSRIKMQQLADSKKLSPAADRITKKGHRVGGSIGLSVRRGR
jgi:hypothetical protein